MLIVRDVDKLPALLQNTFMRIVLGLERNTEGVIRIPYQPSISDSPRIYRCFENIGKRKFQENEILNQHIFSARVNVLIARRSFDFYLGAYERPFWRNLAYQFRFCLP